MRITRNSKALLLAAALCAIGLGGGPASAQTSTTPAATASPAPATPTPSPTPYASAAIGGDLLLGGFQTYSTAQNQGFDDVTDMLVNASITSGLFKASATVGGYNFPTLGVPFNATFTNLPGTNTNEFNLVPLAEVQYNSGDGHVNVQAGKLGTMLGAEGIFTYQNLNIQRGLAWNLEPVISRGVHLGYTNGLWSYAVEYNDGYYTGRLDTIEYSLAWAPRVQRRSPSSA